MRLWNVDKKGELKIFFSTVRAGLPRVPKGTKNGPSRITQIDTGLIQGFIETLIQ
jgi:hypothetical protein